MMLVKQATNLHTRCIWYKIGNSTGLSWNPWCLGSQTAA